MSNEYDDYERAIRADRKRRAIREEKRRRRRRNIMIKRAAAVAFACIVIVVAVVAMNGGHKDTEGTQESAMDAKATVNVAADASVPTETTAQGPLVKYPVKSSSYQEITDEGIRSPYIAVLDVENSKVIAGRDCETKIYPASMTKVMTLIVAVEKLKDLNATFQFTAEMIAPLYQAEASRAGFDPEETVTVNDMLYGLVLPSGADAAVGLATLTAGSEDAFAELMNAKCKELGLTKTHFTNASGLYDEDQYTTPIEMALIMQYAMSIPQCATVLSTYQHTTAVTQQHPEGILLSSTMFSRMYGTEVEGVTITAGKTGYTVEAGNCLVSYAEKNGHHYVALTANASYKWYVIFDDFEIYGKYLP